MTTLKLWSIWHLYFLLLEKKDFNLNFCRIKPQRMFDSCFPLKSYTITANTYIKFHVKNYVCLRKLIIYRIDSSFRLTCIQYCIKFILLFMNLWFSTNINLPVFYILYRIFLAVKFDSKSTSLSNCLMLKYSFKIAKGHVYLKLTSPSRKWRRHVFSI